MEFVLLRDSLSASLKDLTDSVMVPKDDRGRGWSIKDGRHEGLRGRVVNCTPELYDQLVGWLKQRPATFYIELPGGVLGRKKLFVRPAYDDEHHQGFTQR
jgi:hypothetical protein